MDSKIEAVTVFLHGAPVSRTASTMLAFNVEHRIYPGKALYVDYGTGRYRSRAFAMRVDWLCVCNARRTA